MKHEDEDIDLIDVGDNLQRILDYSSALHYYMDHFGPYEDEFVQQRDVSGLLLFQDQSVNPVRQPFVKTSSRDLQGLF